MLSSPLFLAAAVAVIHTNAFVLTSTPRLPSSLGLSYDPYQGNDSSSSRDALKARTDIRNFLTQRSIQSFVFLLNQCHEEHTVRWLENKLDFKKVDSFHGTGAFNLTLFPEWDSLFLDLATQDAETVIIEVVQKTTHRGWGHQANYVNSISSNTGGDDAESSSSSNPWTPPAPSQKWPPARGNQAVKNYLANLNTASSEKKEPSDPPSKKPVPKAFGAQASYLESLSQPQPKKEEAPEEKPAENSKKPSSTSAKKWGPQRNYLESLSSNTIDASSTPTEPPSTELRVNPHMEEKTKEYHFEIDPPSLVTRIISVREQISKEWKEDLDTLVRTNDRILDEYEENQLKAEAAADLEDDDEDDDEEESAKEKAAKGNKMMPSPYSASQDGKTLLYDRSAMAYLTNSIASQDRDSSPFRKSNFDLLLLLCTQESVHRVLREYLEDTDDEMYMDKYEWLNNFYKANVKEYFDGHEYSFGRADKFLETLLVQAPVARETRTGGLYLISPIAMTEDILRERSMVAREWKSIVGTIPDEHLDLRRILFSRHLMEATTDWKLDGISADTLYIPESSFSFPSNATVGTFE